MLKALGLQRGSPSPRPGSPSASTLKTSLAVLDDAIELENGLRAMDLVMDDQPTQAQEMLKDGDSTYFKLARGVIHFIEATLSFEADAIKQAVDSLYEAEQASQRDRQKSQKLGIQTSSKYPPGMEYSITLAESHLLGAISLFLSESVVDSVKALYKLRKAYQVLDEVNRTIKSNKTQSKSSSAGTNKMDGASTPSSVVSSTSTKIGKDDEEMAEKAKKVHLARVQRLHRSTNMSVETLAETAESRFANQTSVDYKTAGYESVDDFIESGVNALFGLLQLVISIIPPGFGKVLSIVGFHGDRDEGLRMMWKATKTLNIHGSVALLALLQYYDGPTQFSDIELPDDDSANNSSSGGSSVTSGTFDEDQDEEDDSGKTPAQEFAIIKKRLEKALESIRKFYSKGALWQLQEGRMVASKGDLKGAVKIMDDDSNGPIQMKQVEGLMLFDKTIMLVILHEFERAAGHFVELIKLNSWSHAFYSYMSAACQIEIYREYKTSDPEKAANAKKQATECLEKIPSLLKKKGFMAKAMPFDVFAQRKLHQWKEIAANHNVDLVDAVGTSPIHEVIYFWNGFGKMPQDQLEQSLQMLGYSGDSDTPFGNGSGALKEVEDEQITRILLQSIVLRTLGRHDEGLKLMEKYVLPKIWTPQPTKGYTKSGLLPKVQYNKSHRDPYAGPSAIYERAIFEWQMNGIVSKPKVEDYLDLATHWADDYELSTRVGMRIKSAVDRLELM